jgi:hypothetical protein
MKQYGVVLNEALNILMVGDRKKKWLKEQLCLCSVPHDVTFSERGIVAINT